MNEHARPFPEDLAIRVDGIGKEYRLGVLNRHALRDELIYAWERLQGRDPKKTLGKIGDKRLSSSGLFKALDHVSFDVAKGETVGLIGHNGAGKSTMLKLLARITSPTYGEARLRGRVGALLEVGTGFHPELTGRENIYMNGTILGMHKEEIDRKFDEIVDFSEVGEFLDTPVKRYSSGMYVKLAFAVASSLDTDTLLLDEVLSVGDASFRKKSLARMKEIADAGRTILFVSHNPAHVLEICSRCIWFDSGVVRMDGRAGDVLKAYNDSTKENDRDPQPVHAANLAQSFHRSETTTISLRGVEVSFDDSLQSWAVRIQYDGGSQGAWVNPRVIVSIRRGGSRVAELPILVCDSYCNEGLFPDVLPSCGTLVLRLSPDFRLPKGVYSVDVRLLSGFHVLLQEVRAAANFSVGQCHALPGWKRKAYKASVVNVRHGWEFQQ